MGFFSIMMLILGTAGITILFVRNQIGAPLDHRVRELERRVKVMGDFLEANSKYRTPN
jgi:hypothetical protein